MKDGLLASFYMFRITDAGLSAIGDGNDQMILGVSVPNPV